MSHPRSKLDYSRSVASNDCFIMTYLQGTYALKSWASIAGKVPRKLFPFHAPQIQRVVVNEVAEFSLRLRQFLRLIRFPAFDGEIVGDDAGAGFQRLLEAR